MDPRIREVAAGDIMQANIDTDALARRLGHVVLAAFTEKAEEDEWVEDRTNLQKAQNGRDMVALAHTGSSYLAYEAYEAGLVDALVNLMHYARRYEIDFQESLEEAKVAHAHDARLGWDDES